VYRQIRPAHTTQANYNSLTLQRMTDKPARGTWSVQQSAQNNSLLHASTEHYIVLL